MECSPLLVRYGATEMATIIRILFLSLSFAVVGHRTLGNKVSIKRQTGKKLF